MSLDVLGADIEDNVITGFVMQNPAQEANAITTGAASDVLVINNELSGNGETIMMNGAFLGYTQSEALQTPLSTGLMPTRFAILGNYAHKPIEWINLIYTKNLIECKTCRDTRNIGNLLEYSFEGAFSDGQYGAAIVVQNRNGGNTTGDIGRPWMWTRTSM